MPDQTKLDDYDKSLLRLLQEDASRSQKELAELIHLSPAAVQRRIAKLQKKGIIKKFAAVVDPAAVGLPVTVIVEVTLSDERSVTVAAAKKMFKNAEEIQQCYWVAGSAGLILIMTVPTTEEYESRTAQLLGENHLVKSYRTIIVLDRVKVDLSLPL
ncbi:Lrp/AsnC family transcriptional regulator [Pseudochrobactrum sp. B5]|uniref:Lrp/AsnC family transcriptional regulator n=1 Tax=Pseudochrobactrum sp. B5 TaxID=1289478 RepID=UPI0009523FD4|nr:Lrp/AsnC family transcriptional regulator [Pseudochrobactrum sp. B5]